MIAIDELKRINRLERIVITEHARTRLFERGISVKDVINCINNGKIIEQYENDIFMLLLARMAISFI